MKLILTAIMSLATVYNSSIYSFTIQSIDHASLNLNQYRGKKIMVVNIATSSDKVNQLAELQELYEQYKDSLVIIGFPSNSFGNEQRTDSAIKAFCATAYGVSFVLAAKGSVKGASAQPIYKWLVDKSQNGFAAEDIKDDFQKYIVDTTGEVVGIFAGRTSPHHPGILKAITGN